jgi:hypothetical protein
MASLKLRHLIHFSCGGASKVSLKSSCESSDGTFGIVDVMGAGQAGQTGFFLFLTGRGFFPKRVAESCARSQAGKLLIVACVL